MTVNNVWWCSIDTKYSSYLELKYRKVIAQGWPGLGDLSRYFSQFPDWKKNWKGFCQVIQNLGDVYYDDWRNKTAKHRQPHSAPTVIWNLLSIKKCDLIVAREGTTVKGICQIEQNGWESYRYDNPDVWNEAFTYAQTVGFPVNWVDWDEEIFDFVPIPPRMLLGIRALKVDKERVIEAWKKYQADFEYPNLCSSSSEGE
jgi:hypothetical protein